MKIDKKLNLVIPLERDTGTIYVFSTPITREVFEAHYKVISKTFTQLWAGGLGLHGGPRVAALELRSVAQSTPRVDGEGSMWDGPEGVEATLMNEIRRLTNVLLPAEDGRGYTNIPYDTAVNQKLLTDEEMQEVEGAATFFIVNWAMHRRVVAIGILTSAAVMWGQRVTSLPLSEYRSTLTVSTPPEPTGGSPQLSSVPS